MNKIKKSEYTASTERLKKEAGLPFADIFEQSRKNRRKYFSLQRLKNSLVFKQKVRKLLHFLRLIYRTRSFHLDQMKKYGISFESSLKLSDIGFPKHTKPDASIIIPVYNKLEITLRCLASLSRHESEYTFEVVLVDNNSHEPVADCLKEVPGLKLVANNENLGYVGGCNSGAQHANGKTLVFLNNDTEVFGGWLDNLMRRLDDKSVGMVGSKLIYPDGSLQEAGGIVFKDASGNNYGKHSDAGSFKYNYTTKVDYVSGASIAISKQLFNKYGGFDELYSPAYYEDTDLAFKVRSDNLDVVYEPDSVVVHVEGATAGTDLNSGFKKYQVRNQKRFKKRWEEELSKQPSPEENIFSARTHLHKNKVLFIDNSIPEPDKDSGSVREWAILTLLKELDSHVTFWPANLVASQPYTPRLQSMGIEVVYGEDVDFTQIMKEREDCYTHVFFARPFVGARFLEDIKKHQPSAKVIYDTVDLHYLRTERQAEIEGAGELREQAKDWRNIEQYLIQEADTTLVVSPLEKEILKADGYSTVQVLSNIHTLKEMKTLPTFEDRSGLFFIGSFNHTPNVDAMIWFCNDILPLIRKKLPNITLTIVGSNPPRSVTELDDLEGVTVRGYVEDVDPLFDEARVFISPLRYGAGVKGKIGQSISLGLPIVTTSIGAEGMYLQNEKDCLIEDSEEGFAEAAIRLYNHKTLWGKAQASSRKTLNKHLSVNAAEKVIREIVK